MKNSDEYCVQGINRGKRFSIITEVAPTLSRSDAKDPPAIIVYETDNNIHNRNDSKGRCERDNLFSEKQRLQGSPPRY